MGIDLKYQIQLNKKKLDAGTLIPLNQEKHRSIFGFTQTQMDLIQSAWIQ